MTIEEILVIPLLMPTLFVLAILLGRCLFEDDDEENFEHVDEYSVGLINLEHLTDDE